MARQSEIEHLRRELHAAREHPEANANDAQYYFNAVTIIIGVAAIVIAVVAIGATVLGYRMVRSYVQSEFAGRAETAFEEHGKPIIEAALRDASERLNAKLAEADAKLAEELELHGRAAGGQP